MTIAQVLALLRFLDGLFSLGGRLLTAARQREPVLRTEDPGPLDEVERARADALARAHGRGGS